MEMKIISRFAPFAYVAENGTLGEVACWVGSVRATDTRMVATLYLFILISSSM